MTDQEYRTAILGAWRCEDPWMPQTVTFKSDLTHEIRMSTSTLITGIVGFFSGTVCKGTWEIHGSVLRISFDEVPQSWLDFRWLKIGSSLTKLSSQALGLSQMTKCEIKKLDEDEMILAVARGWGEDIKWSKVKHPDPPPEA